MKTILHKFLKNRDGVVSVEFSLIAPMLIFGTLFAINLGYQVNKQQKVEASLAAGSNYLQDFALNHNMAELRPNYDSETGKTNDTQTLSTVKKIIQTASGGMIEAHETYVNTYCACPNNKVPDQDGGSIDENNFEMTLEPVNSGQKDFDFTDYSKDYYSKTRMSLFRKGELCAFDCPQNGGRARVIVEMDVYHNVKDLFGKSTIIHEKLQTRIR